MTTSVPSPSHRFAAGPAAGSNRLGDGSLPGAPARGRGRKRPKPSRAALDRAEKALADLEARQAAERAELARDEEKLASKRRALEGRHGKSRAAAEAKRDAAEARYRETMRDWAG